MLALLRLMRVEVDQEVAGYPVAFAYDLARPPLLVADQRGLGKEDWAIRKAAWEKAGYHVLSYADLL
jgi:hypothetical protein